MAARAEFSFKGLPGLKRNLRKARINFADAMERALYRVAQDIMRESKKNYVPVDLGVLRASGFVDKPKRVGRELSVRLSYGGAAKAYALAVHEHPSKHSPPSWQKSRFGVRFQPAGHGPKYLEIPIRKLGQQLPSRMYNELARML